MTKNIISKFILTGLLTIISVGINAQCNIDNRHFQSGEVLSYDLYFKYGILHTKAGNASLTVANTKYRSKDAYRLRLTARSSGIAKSLYSLNDTLISYTTKGLVPLAYTKDAHEKGDYATERATYDYSSGKVKMHTINSKNGNLRYDTTLVADKCMYDVLSIVYYARTLDYSSMAPGDKKTVPFWSGRTKVDMDIEYHGIESVSANDGREYNCIKLVLMMNDKAFENKNEAMRVYLTDDLNHIPVRIDSKLKVGSTRVILNGYKGLRN